LDHYLSKPENIIRKKKKNKTNYHFLDMENTVETSSPGIDTSVLVPEYRILQDVQWLYEQLEIEYSKNNHPTS